MGSITRFFTRSARWAAIVSLVATGALASAQPIFATAISWVNPGTSGEWQVPSNWVGGVVPGAADDVTLPTGTPYEVTLDNATSFAANSVTTFAGAKLVIKGTGTTTLTVTNNVSNSGTIEIGQTAAHAPAKLSVGGTLTNNTGGLIQTLGFGGTDLDANLDNQGSLTTAVNAPVTMSKVGATISTSGTITANGQLSIFSATSFTMSGGTITNNSVVQVHGGSVTHTGGTVTGDALTLFGVTLSANASSGNGLFRLVNIGNVLGSNVSSHETLIVEGGYASADGVLSSSVDRINNGTIQLQSQDPAHTARLLFSSTKTLTNLGTLETLPGGQGADRQFQGNLSNQGTFNVGYDLDFDQASASLVQTSGTTTLGAELDLTGSAGSFALNGGTLMGNGIMTGLLQNTGGTVAPGFSPGILTINGQYNQQLGGTLAIEIGGTVAGSNNDRLVITGGQLNGTLAITRLNNFVPTNSFNYDFVTATSSISGAFGTVTGTDAGGGKTFVVNVGSSAANLTVTGGGPTRQPDGLIAVGSGPFIGGNIYNSDASNQTKSKTGNAGSTFTFKIRIQNDGTGKEKFKAHATGLVVIGYTVTFKKGTTNITNAVMNGTFTTAKIAVGSFITIKCIVRIGSAAPHSSTTDRLVTISSFNDPGQEDAVELIVGRN